MKEAGVNLEYPVACNALEINILIRRRDTQIRKFPDTPILNIQEDEDIQARIHRP